MIAEVQLTFGESVAQSEVEALLKEMTKSGNLGQFSVDQPKVAMVVGSGKSQNFT